MAIGMGGFCVLLMFGTAILNARWVLLVAAASLGVGLYRLRGAIPSKYRLAQIVDRRLRLADALSTATHFSGPDAFGDEAIRARQREEAETIARAVDVRAAIPLTRPRFFYLAMALAAVAFGLFALRFAMTGSLTLQPSLVQIAFDTFFPEKPQQLALNQKNRDSSKSAETSQGQPDAPEVAKQQPEVPPDETFNADEQQDGASETLTDESKEGSKDGKNDPNQSPNEKAEKGDRSQNGNDAGNDSDKAQDSKSNDQKNAQNAKQSSNENSSLMDKLKDALANMMNKMKPSPSQNGNQNQQNTQKDAQSGQQKSNQKGQQSQKQTAQNDNSEAQSDQNDNGDKNQSADAKKAEKSSDRNASPNSQSGIGSEDGDKSAHEAEQLQAMGKITEILGKRAQNVSGEVMVEVGSSKQQLKTPWAPKEATHSDAGGEIHRDEVPLIYQQFVEQYFEQIRKAPDPAKAKSKD